MTTRRSRSHGELLVARWCRYRRYRHPRSYRRHRNCRCFRGDRFRRIHRSRCRRHCLPKQEGTQPSIQAPRHAAFVRTATPAIAPFILPAIQSVAYVVAALALSLDALVVALAFAAASAAAIVAAFLVGAFRRTSLAKTGLAGVAFAAIAAITGTYVAAFDTLANHVAIDSRRNALVILAGFTAIAISTVAFTIFAAFHLARPQISAQV